MKIYFFLLIFIQQILYSQSVKQNDRYGNSIVFEDGLILKTKDKYGIPIYYIDGQTIKSKKRYGAALFYIDGNTLEVKIAMEKLYIILTDKR